MEYHAVGTLSRRENILQPSDHIVVELRKMAGRENFTSQEWKTKFCYKEPKWRYQEVLKPMI